MEKQRWEESEKRSQEVRRSERRKSEKKEDAGGRKGRKVAKHSFLPMVCGSGGSKRKAARAEPAGQLGDENCTPVWRKAHFQVKMSKHTILRHSQTIFGSSDFETVHSVVARSIFPSQHVQNTPFSDILRPLLEAQISKQCVLSWRKRYFQVNMHKAHHSQTTFGSSGVEKVHAIVARITSPSQNVQNTQFSDHIWKFRCRYSARRCGTKRISKSKVSKTGGLEPFWRSDAEKEPLTNN